MDVAEFSRFPFGLPQDHRNSQLVNALLQKSLKIQHAMGMTRACCFICIILRKCLTALGIDAEIVYGCTEFNSFKTPHVWLEIDGYIVDNSFNVGEVVIDELIKSKMLNKYIARLDRNDQTLFLDDGENEPHIIEVTNWSITNQDKAILICQNLKHIKDYYNTLVIYVQRHHNIDICLPVVTGCWGCGLVTTDLKSCSKCKVAKYCGKTCQKKDWRSIHRTICRPPDTVAVKKI